MVLVAKLRAFKVFFTSLSEIPFCETHIPVTVVYQNTPFVVKICASLWCAWSICLEQAPKVCTNNLLCHFSGCLIPENDHNGLHATWALSYKLRNIFVEACLCCLCQKQVLHPCNLCDGVQRSNKTILSKSMLLLKCACAITNEMLHLVGHWFVFVTVVDDPQHPHTVTAGYSAVNLV